MRLSSFFALFLMVALPVSGQQAGDPVARWHESQVQAARRIGAVTCTERSERRLDGPQGAKEIHTVVRVRALPGQPNADRDVTAVEMNGREVPDDQRRRVMRYIPHGRQERERVSDMLFAPMVFVPDLRREGAARPDPAQDGAWRVDLLGRDDHPVERLTLWFTDRGDRLVRSRLLARQGAEAPPFVIETAYRRRSGLDVPDTRHIEGSMVVRKRSRTYTVLYEQQTAYRDYRFER